MSSAIIRATLRKASESRRELYVDALHRGLTELRIECLGPAPPELPEWLRTLRVLRSALAGYIEQVTGELRAVLEALSDSFAELIRQIEDLLAAGAQLLEDIGKLAGDFDEWVAQKIEAAVLAALNMLADVLPPQVMAQVLQKLEMLAELLGPALAVDDLVHRQGLKLVTNVTGLSVNQGKGLVALVGILLLAGRLLRGLGALARGLLNAVKRFRERRRAGARPSPGGNGRGERPGGAEAPAGLDPNVAARRRYLDLKKGLETMESEMRAGGASSEQIGRKMVAARNDMKVAARELMTPEGRALVEQRNMKQWYHHPVGPTADQMYGHYGTWERVIEAAKRTDPALDRLVTGGGK